MAKINTVCLNSLKNKEKKIKIVKEIPEIIKDVKKNNEDIFYIIRLKKHISILMKYKDEFVSLDSSNLHVNLLKENGLKIKHFERILQSTGSCCFYSLKFLEIILQMDAKSNFTKFINGVLLIKIIKSMGNIFTTIDGKKYFFTNPNELNSFNKSIKI